MRLKKKPNPLIGIIMGSDSDLEVMAEAAKLLDSFGIPYEISIISAHRTPKKTHEYVSSAKKRGLRILIAGAGGAAHLAGVAASLTTLPVIGVPIHSPVLSGLDSLLSTVQMPSGIPVATVAINNARNAGLLAVHILALSNARIATQLTRYRLSLKASVEKKAAALQKHGYKNYKR